jgi:outer membrane protein TolC
MHRKLLLLPFLFALFCTGKLYAQTESFIPDINPLYLQKLIDTAKKYYPEVKVRTTQVNIARTSYHQANVSWFDVITPSYLYNPSQSTNLITPIAANSYQLAVTVNIGTLLAKPFVIHNAKQAVDVATYQKQEYMMNLETNIKKFYYTYLETQADLRLRSRAEQDAGANVKQMKSKFEKAEATLKDYNDALVIMYTQTSYRIQGELAVFNAKVSLEELVGKKLEDIK